VPYPIICHTDDARANFAFALAEIPIEQPTKRDNHDSRSFIRFALAAFAAIDVRPSVPESYKPWCVGNPWVGTTCARMAILAARPENG
jgi:hypothetical protein